MPCRRLTRERLFAVDYLLVDVAVRARIVHEAAAAAVAVGDGVCRNRRRE